MSPPRPQLRLDPDQVRQLADALAESPQQREIFLRDPAAWMRARGMAVHRVTLREWGPPAATSEVCTVNAACNVNSMINVNAATKVNAISAVNAAITANAGAFVNFIAAYRTVVFNQSRFWGAPVNLTVTYLADATLGRDDGLV